MYKLALILALVTLSRTAEADQRQIRGVLRFNDYDDAGANFTGRQPVRWVTVKIKLGSTTLSTAMTGHDGYFSRWLDTAQLPVNQTLTIELVAENYASHVYLDLDGENDWITWRVDLPITAGTGALDFSHDFTRFEGSVHLSILDAVTYGRQYADLRRDDTDDITQVDVEYPEDSDTTSYSAFWDEITVQGPQLLSYPYGGGTVNNGWRDLVLLHEFGHHLDYYISELQSGGSHRACADSGHTYWFAWKEGFPSYFSWAVGQAYPLGIQGVPGEETPTEVCPPQSENITRMALWDLHDAANEAHDLIDGARVVAGGKDLRRIIFEIFDHEQENDIGNIYVQNTIETFHDAWVARNLYSGSHAEIDKLLFASGIVPHTKPDMAAVSVSVNPATVNAGQSTRMTIQAARSGYIYPDESLRGRFYLWKLNTGILPVTTFSVGPFPLGPFTTPLIAIPSSVPPGSYALWFEVDTPNRISESNESNNLAWTLITVLAPLPPPIEL